MRSLLLVLLLAASVGAALVYRLRRRSFDKPLGRTRAKALAWGLLTTALVAILLIGFGIPVRSGMIPLAVSAATFVLAATLSTVAWFVIPPWERETRREISSRLVMPMLGCVSAIMFTAYLTLPAGWHWV